MLLAIEKWVEDTAYELVGGNKLLLRLSPRVGKSHLVRLLADEIGESAILADGAAFTEVDQTAQRHQLEAQILKALELHGSAQVIFDSYDKALARSQGPRLQSWLTSRLIDSQHAQDVGAIFTARCGTQIHRGGAGSPLMSRVLPLAPPLLEVGHHTDEELTELHSWFGNAALIADQAHRAGQFQPETMADRIEQDLTFIEDVRRASATAIARGRTAREYDSYAARCAAYGLLTDDGPTKLFERLSEALREGPAEDPIWPDDWASSVKRFAQLIAGADEVIWSDRYMFRDIEPLRAFLKEVALKVRCKVFLLGSDSVNGRSISKAEMMRLTCIQGIEARWMTPSDFRDLHDRHLVTGAGGWVMPQVHVIVGRQARGSTVAAHTASFGVDYPSIWRRSIVP